MGALRKWVDKIKGTEAKYRVRSHTEPHRFYIVEVLKNGETTCNCVAGGFSRLCRHQKLVQKYAKRKT